MIYCKKCARILEEDVKQCPYCLAEEEAGAETPWEPEGTPDLWGTDAFDGRNGLDSIERRTEEMDRLFGKADEEQAREEDRPEVTGAEEVNAEEAKTEDSITEDSIREDSITEEMETVETEPEAMVLEAAPAPNAPEVIDIKPAGGGAAFEGNAAEQDEFISPAAKLAIALGCALFPPVGVVVAVVFLNKKSGLYRRFGLLLLALMLVEIVFSCFCCGAAGFSNFGRYYWYYS